MTDPRLLECAEQLQVVAADALADAQALTRIAGCLLGDNEDRRRRAAGILKKYAAAGRYGADEASGVIEALDAMKEAPKRRSKIAKRGVRQSRREQAGNVLHGPWSGEARR